MKIFMSKGKLQVLKSLELDIYEYYVLGKQKRVSFNKAARTTKSKCSELVHTNVWGPTQVSSLGGSLYFVTFIDDATRKLWLNCFKCKSNIFDTF